MTTLHLYKTQLVPFDISCSTAIGLRLRAFLEWFVPQWHSIEQAGEVHGRSVDKQT